MFENFLLIALAIAAESIGFLLSNPVGWLVFAAIIYYVFVRNFFLVATIMVSLYVFYKLGALTI